METRNKPRYNEKVDRNNEILQDRLSGLSWSKLSFKYQLNIKTIFAIVKRLQTQPEPVTLEQNNSRNINSN
jgi:Mor family transcriptional regulator